MENIQEGGAECVWRCGEGLGGGGDGGDELRKVVRVWKEEGSSIRKFKV